MKLFTTVYTHALPCNSLYFFFFNDTATTEIYTLSLHDALPICGSCLAQERPGNCRPAPGRQNRQRRPAGCGGGGRGVAGGGWRLGERFREGSGGSGGARGQQPALQPQRSEEHQSELQSPCKLACR